MTLHLPPQDPRPYLTGTELTAFWASLVDSEPLRQRCLWLLFLDAELRPVGPLVSIDDLPDGPYDANPDNLVGLCLDLIDGPGAAESVAMLVTRPGGAPWTVSDRAWGRFLLKAAEAIGSRTWPLFRAHRWELEEFRLAPG